MKDETKESLCINGGAVLCGVGLSLIHPGLAIAVLGIALITAGVTILIDRERND